MPKIMIGFTNEELTLATSMIEYAKTKLQKQYDESYSGVDQVLINSWILSASELLTKFEEATPKPENQAFSGYQIQTEA